MDMLPRPTTCPARFPATLGAARPQCDRLPHTDRLHIAAIGTVPFAWADPDNGALGDWESATLAAVHDVYGDTPTPADPDVEARYAALIDAVEVLVARLRGRATDPAVRGVVTAYDQLTNPAAVSA